MSIRAEFQEAGIEYARRQTEAAQTQRLAALALEAQRASNAAAFAAAITEATPADDTETTA